MTSKVSVSTDYLWPYQYKIGPIAMLVLVSVHHYTVLPLPQSYFVYIQELQAHLDRLDSFQAHEENIHRFASPSLTATEMHQFWVSYIDF